MSRLINKTAIATVVIASTVVSSALGAPFIAVKDGKGVANIVADTRGALGGNGPLPPKTILQHWIGSRYRPAGQDVHWIAYAAHWLAKSVARSTGAELPVTKEMGEHPSIIIALASQYPNIAAKAGFKSKNPDAFCVYSTPRRLYILGASGLACRHGAGKLLNRLGFRWFGPSPHWWIAPKGNRFVVDVSFCDEPRIQDRAVSNMSYFGQALEDPFAAAVCRWDAGNGNNYSFDGTVTRAQSGAYWQRIIRLHRKEFDKHPEYYALLANGKRDDQRRYIYRKLCVSNPGLVRLVVDHYLKAYEAQKRKGAPFLSTSGYMLSVGASAGFGRCHCEACRKIGTATDMTIHLANKVARALRDKYPDAWVGLPTFDDNLLPPTTKAEPNVFARLILGVSRARRSPRWLISKWSDKVGAIGIKEYGDSFAWDGALPGRMRGTRLAKVQERIPYYIRHKVRHLNSAFTPCPPQILSAYITAHLAWNPDADVNALVNDYFVKCFGKAAGPMRRLQQRFALCQPLNHHTLIPMFRDVEEAYTIAEKGAEGPAVLRRIVDVMSYLHYVMLFRDFCLVRDSQPSRNTAYYQALHLVMAHWWDTLDRHMTPVAITRSFCNRLAKLDNRLDFFIENHLAVKAGHTPIWMSEDRPINRDHMDPEDPRLMTTERDDRKMLRLFRADIRRLSARGDPRSPYSRQFAWVTSGSLSGAAKRTLRDGPPGRLDIQGGLRGYLAPGIGQRHTRIRIRSKGPGCAVSVYDGLATGGMPMKTRQGSAVILDKACRKVGQWEVVDVKFPKPDRDYPVRIAGDFELEVPQETPLTVEASWSAPLQVAAKSGPLYFYVPSGARRLVLDCDEQLHLRAPGHDKARAFTPSDRSKEHGYIVLEISRKAAGKVWTVTEHTKGSFRLINVPPFLSFRSDWLVLPKGVAMGDHLLLGWVSKEDLAERTGN